ncbi:MAG: FlgD immunoglobulin-like domain containing protein [Candidatus Latescibacterota bacterium]
MPPLTSLAVLLSVLCSAGILHAQDSLGYRLLPNQVRIDRAEDWSVWDTPPGVQVIGFDGAVEPRFLRSDINVSLDAERFIYVNPFVSNDTLQGGVHEAGSNVLDGSLVLDGDGQTYWEPERDTAIDNWFIEVDLGRAVVAHRVVLRFVDKELGDPFLKFRVVASDGQRFGEEQRRRFYRVGLETQPNKDRREYAFDIVPQRPVGEGIVGEVMQYLRIDVLDTDGPRAAEVSSDQYDLLPEEDRGAIDFFRVTPAGRQILIGEDTWKALAEDERGAVRYYRYERPRLAEVEVYSLGENIVQLTQSERELGAGESGFEFLFFRIYTDGLYSSAFPMRVYDPVTDENQLVLDLGAKYWLNRIKLLMPEGPPPAYQLRISDGAFSANGEQVWTSLGERQNLSGYQHVEETFSTREVRYIELRRLEFSNTSEEGGELSEVQAFGEGYVSEVAMVSPFIRLNRPRLFTTVEWDADVPPGTRIEVRTRSGEQIEEIPHYFATTGREISRELWELLPESRRPPVVIEERAGPDWSNWSEIYEGSGIDFKSPSPRGYAQIEVRLVSREPLRAARIRSLQLNFEPPLVDNVLGEIWPIWEVEPGVEREFTLYVRPQFALGNPGFDLLRLRSSSDVPIELVSVRSGTDAVLRLGGGQTLWPGVLEDALEEDGSVALSFPRPVLGGNGVYELKFKTKVFLQSTVFSAELERQTRPGRVQRVSGGDASALVSSQTLVVVSDLEETQLLRDVRVEPRAFTPNGDGINDRARIELSIYHVEGEKRVEVGLFDLSGRRVRDLSARRLRPSGEHAFLWDGRNEDGILVPPGIYAVRVRFSTDSAAEGTQVMRLVHVVY